MVSTSVAARTRSWLAGAFGTAWFRYALVSVVVLAVLVPTLPDESEVVAGVGAEVALLVGLYRHRPRMRRAWVFLTLGQLMYVLSLGGWLAYLYITHEEAPVPTVMDAVCLSFYPVFGVGLALFTRRRVGRSPWEGVLDAVLVALGLAAVVWTLIVDPYRQMSGMPPLTLMTGLAYPVGDLLLALMLALLLFTTSLRNPAMALLTACLLTGLAADGVNTVLIAQGSGMAGNALTYVGWDFASVLLAMAALHPSMAREVEPRRASVNVVSRVRVGLYLVLSVAGPLVIIIAMLTGLTPQEHAFDDVLFSLSVSVAVSLLLVLRLTQIARLANDRAVELDRQRTALEVAQLEQLRAHRRVSAMFESAPTGMALLDHDGVMLAVNPALARFVGRRLNELVGTGIGTLVHAEDLPHVLASLRAAIAGGATEHGEFRGRKITGATLWADYSVSSVSVADNEHTAIMVIADRTAFRKMEIERRNAQKLESIGRLTAGVARELAGPIELIANNVDFVAHSAAKLLEAARSGATPELGSELDELAGEIPEAVRQTKERVHRIESMITALGSFAQRDATGHQPADVNRALSDAITVAHSELRHVSFTLVNLADLPLVPCSIGDLNQVFLNILVNAADAVLETQSPKHPGRISIRSKADGSHVVIEIADTGPGIPPELREKVFEPFFTTKPADRGTGQGLAFARTIVVDGHRGTIDFTSVPGEGTTFTVRLPITAAGPAAVVAVTEPLAAVES